MTVARISLSSLHNVLRSRWGIVYGLFFFAVTEGLFQMLGQSSKVVLSLVNITLFLVPLMSIVFATMYFYNSREFIELLLTQPLRRAAVYAGLFVGLTSSLAMGFVLGVGLPFALHGLVGSTDSGALFTLLFTGAALTWVFVALGFAVAVVQPDRGKGLGIALLIWLFLALVYDGLILAGVHAFSDYPLERPVLAATIANPVDLGRILMLMQVDAAALMGYTGAVFRRFFGDGSGALIAAGSLLLWCVVPFSFGLWRFLKRDF